MEDFPVIEKIKEVMKEAGALNAMMSGSGPSVFGVFESPEKAKSAEECLRALGYTAYAVKSVV